MSTPTDTTLHAGIATAFAAALPGAYSIAEAAPGAVAADAQGLVASFVGERSADLLLVLSEDSALSAAVGRTGPVALGDVLRPAFESAAAELGAGVVGEVREGELGAIAGQERTALFALVTEGQVAGWFGVNLRPLTASAPAAPAPAPGALANIGRIASVEMALTVEIGRTRMLVRDVLALRPGSVIELDRSVGSPANILLNGRIIANGEVVVVDQDYAVRVTSILDAAEAV